MLRRVKTGVKRILAATALVSVEIIVLLFMFTIALTAFILIVRSVFTERKTAFDTRAFNYLAVHVSNVNTHLMELFSFLGTHLFLIPANLLLITYFLFIKKHRWYSIKVPVVAVSSLLLMFLLKLVFHRDRPMVPLLNAAKGFSFPSGHAMMSVTFYGLMITIVWETHWRVWQKWMVSILLILLILAIGLSRVYLRVHYASDVLAGFCVGCMWLLLALWLLGKMETFSRRTVAPIVEENKRTTSTT